jgi:FMN-dependent NADH-azoreductase
MSTILHIDASPRVTRSHSRTLAHAFLDARRKAHPKETRIHRDLAQEAPALPTEAWIAAAFGHADPKDPATGKVLAESDALVDELLKADRIVLATPMHNFSIPAALKAYIDNIVRLGRTFSAGPEGYKGLVPAGRKALVITARGGAYAPGTPFAAYDHQEPYLRTILGFIGITDVTFVHAEGINLGEEAAKQGLAGARNKLAELARTW